MLAFLRKLHNKRPLFWTVVAFVIVVVTATALSIWWNVLLVQNHRILRTMTAAATDPSRANIPFALLMVIGLALSLMIVLGLVYMFLRLIRAVQLNLAQSQFIAAVTHELKSPVAGLQIMFDTIRDPTTPPEKRREFEECMGEDLRRLRQLVDQVLDTARLETVVSAVEFEEVQLKSLIEQCCRNIEARLKTTGSKLKCSVIDEAIYIKGNRRLLVSALMNILDNAVKYSNGPADIAVDVIKEVNTIAIEVHDRGIGMTRKEQKRVFRRFYRATEASTRAKPGTGLGLYFTRLAIKAQGGEISVRSLGLGHGSTFRLELPRL